MFFPFLTLLSTLIGALWLTHSLFDLAFHRERAQIGVDNASILLGRQDRETLNWLNEQNRQMRQLEILHHAVHECARNPKTSILCVPKDGAVEGQMTRLRWLVSSHLQVRWQNALLNAQNELLRLQVLQSEIFRPSLPPIQTRVCALCRGVVAWKIQVPSLLYRVLSSGAGAAVRIKKEGAQLAWQYQLEEPPI